jgi:hypothetical protein
MPGPPYVIWPDNLFDNGSLHDYSGPVAGRIGYEGHEIRPTPDLSVYPTGASDPDDAHGRVRSVTRRRCHSSVRKPGRAQPSGKRVGSRQ